MSQKALEQDGTGLPELTAAAGAGEGKGTVDAQTTQVPDLETPTAPSQISLTAEEFDAKIQEAVKLAEKDSSSKEKQKLYDTIEKLKADKHTADEKLKLFEAQEIQKREELEVSRLSKLSADEIRDEQIKKANLELEQVKMAFEMLKQETAENLTKKDLEIYRERLISQAEGGIIPDLVSGSTKEELDANFVKATERFNQIKSQVEAELKDTLKHQSSQKTTVSQETPHQTKQTTATETRTFSSEEIKNMTPEQYSKYKEDVLAQFGI